MTTDGAPATYALISDIHANLPALESVLQDIERRQVDAVSHLGDLVGYAPWADEVRPDPRTSYRRRGW